MQSMIKLWLTSVLLCGTCLAVEAQSITHEGEAWAGYISALRVGGRWSVWNDFHYVGGSFFVNRHGLTYHLGPRLECTAGYAFVATATSFSDRLIRHEHRPWGQVVGRLALGGRWEGRLRFRYDARYRQRVAGGELVADDWIFYHRLRAMADLRFTLKTLPRGRRLQLALMDEVLWNVGRQVPNGLDQNRLYVLLVHRWPQATLMGGYHWRAIPRPSEGYVFRHGFTVWLVHTMDVRRRPTPHGADG